MRWIVPLAIILFIIGCGESVPTEHSMFEAEEDRAIQMLKTAEPSLIDAAERTKPSINEKIIKEASLNIEVKDVKSSKKAIDELLKNHEAYSDHENYQSSDYQTNYYLTIRVSADQFDALMMALESGDGFILSKTVSSRNVTEEYIDISMRLSNSKKYLAQYNEILKRANTIKEILEVQEKIRKIEEEIESRQGRLNYLDDKVALSTINLTLTQKHSRSVKSKGFFQKVMDAAVQGFKLLQNTLIYLISIWPYLIVLLLFIAFRKHLGMIWPWRRNRNG